MLRTIFDDELLQMFSYVGQKKKKIFSSLASCAIIFGNNIFFIIIKCWLIYYPHIYKQELNIIICTHHLRHESMNNRFLGKYFKLKLQF